MERRSNALKRRPNTSICIVGAIATVYKARRSRQRAAQTGEAVESCPEVDGVAYMPGVYKISMVRMNGSSDEPVSVRVYTINMQKCISSFEGMCGKVRILFMKYHAELQASPSMQA